jgi:hypothetical protein
LFFAHNNHFSKNETNNESEKGKQKIGGKGKRHWKARKKKLTCEIVSLLSNNKKSLP